MELIAVKCDDEDDQDDEIAKKYREPGTEVTPELSVHPG